MRVPALALAAVLAALSALLFSVPAAAEPAAGPAVALPPIPNIPGGALPFNKGRKARFRLVLDGWQHSNASADLTVGSAGCQIKTDAATSEDWEFKRKSGVRFEFVSPRRTHVTLLRRVGRGLGDTAFATTGTVRRGTFGGLSFLGAPPACTGAFPLETKSCDKKFPAPRDLRLDYDPTSDTLKLGVTNDQQRKVDPEKTPVKACGGSYKGRPGLGGLVPLFYYPTLIDSPLDLTEKQIFGKRKTIKINYHLPSFETSTPPPPGTSDTVEVGVHLKLIRERKRKKRH